jgi:hypothetical protein
MYVRTIRSLKKVKACYFVKKKTDVSVDSTRLELPSRLIISTVHFVVIEARARERERRKGILERT